jgi:hypothetical protein
MLEKVQMPPFNAWHPEMLAMSKGQETWGAQTSFWEGEPPLRREQWIHLWRVERSCRSEKWLWIWMGGMWHCRWQCWKGQAKATNKRDPTVTFLCGPGYVSGEVLLD